MNDVLDSLKDIARAVSLAASSSSLERVLQNIAQVALDLVQAHYAALGIPDSNGGLKHFRFAGLTAEEARQIGHLPIGRGLIGAIMKERKTLRLETMSTDPRAVGFCPNHPQMTSLLGVPILVGDRLYGAFYLCDRIDGQPFNDRDQSIIETLAGYAALAIAGAEISEHTSRLTLLEERERISMELHDGVIQSLYAIGMQLELARLSGKLQVADLTGPVNDLNAVIEDIRRYILNLKSRDYLQKTVAETLTDLVQRLHLPETMKTEVNAPSEYPPFSPGVFESICQIAQEAISNAARHSGATHLDITVSEHEHAFQIVIADNGKGFDVDAARKGGGLGLTNVRHRAMLYGGEVSVDSTLGQGTTVTIRIPT